jgi:hypothetical protein
MEKSKMLEQLVISSNPKTNPPKLKYYGGMGCNRPLDPSDPMTFSHMLSLPSGAFSWPKF